MIKSLAVGEAGALARKRLQRVVDELTVQMPGIDFEITSSEKVGLSRIDGASAPKKRRAVVRSMRPTMSISIGPLMANIGETSWVTIYIQSSRSVVDDGQSPTICMCVFIIFGSPPALTQNSSQRAVPKALDKPAAKRRATNKDGRPNIRAKRSSGSEQSPSLTKNGASCSKNSRRSLPSHPTMIGQARALLSIIRTVSRTGSGNRYRGLRARRCAYRAQIPKLPRLLAKKRKRGRFNHPSNTEKGDRPVHVHRQEL